MDKKLKMEHPNDDLGYNREVILGTCVHSLGRFITYFENGSYRVDTWTTDIPEDLVGKIYCWYKPWSWGLPHYQGCNHSTLYVTEEE